MARPIQFARDDVLEKAMLVFWDKGYGATSMTQLVEATGLNPGSLYAAFESKEGLFLAVLDHYGAQSADRVAKALSRAASPLAGIRDYFRGLAGTTSRSRNSCLMVNTVLELGRHNDTVQKRVKQHLEAIERLFRDALTTAQSRGELPADRDPQALAALLMTSIWGIRVLNGTAPEARRTRAVVEQLLRILD